MTRGQLLFRRGLFVAIALLLGLTIVAVAQGRDGAQQALGPIAIRSPT